jgi:hypothetical protein
MRYTNPTGCETARLRAVVDRSPICLRAVVASAPVALELSVDPSCLQGIERRPVGERVTR